ncbi:GDP-mannose 4,6-dehydratase, partial [bacterium]|nr:GDP-mannose 4,6-dehydratase [bacterium]
NEQIMARLIDTHDIIFHLAAAVGVKMIIENPLKSIQINVRGTEIVLERANLKKKKVIITSTSEIYGKNEKVPLSENDERILGSTNIFRWSYSATKAVDEFLALAYFREKKLPIVIVRLFNTCGPRQTGQYGMVIPRFIKQAILNHTITIYGDGEQTRCFCHVSDVLDGMIALSQKQEAVGKIFNLGSTEEIKIKDLAKKILELTGSKSNIEFIPYDLAYEEGFEDMRRRVPDLSKAQELVNYTPNHSLDDLLHDTIDYFKI